MGLFSYVEVPDIFMPENRQNMKNWQTKDVINPFMDTLIITTAGNLIHQWHEYDYAKDPTSWFGLKSVIKSTHEDVLNYHGDMEFYTFNDEHRNFVEMVARFTDGKLEWIKEKEIDNNG